MKHTIMMVISVMTLLAGKPSDAFAVKGYITQAHKDGALPYNLSKSQIAQFAFHGVKPKINSYSSDWDKNWKEYAELLKGQIIAGLGAATEGKVYDAETAESFFLSDEVTDEVVTGTWITTGTERDANGVLQPTLAPERGAYKTSDLGGTEHRFRYKTFKLSRVCANTVQGIKVPEKDGDEPGLDELPGTNDQPTVQKSPKGDEDLKSDDASLDPLTAYLLHQSGIDKGATIMKEGVTLGASLKQCCGQKTTTTTTDDSGLGDEWSDDYQAQTVVHHKKPSVTHVYDDYGTYDASNDDYGTYDVGYTNRRSGSRTWEDKMLTNARATTVGVWVAPLAHDAIRFGVKWLLNRCGLHTGGYYNPGGGDGGNLPYGTTTGGDGGSGGDGSHLPPEFQRTTYNAYNRNSGTNRQGLFSQYRNSSNRYSNRVLGLLGF